MSVYIGNFGEVELKREFSNSDLQSTVNASDVNVTDKRFSFDFEYGQLLTGDQVQITSTDGTALDFIDSYTDTSVNKFIHVDDLGGVRLYDSFANAVNGGATNATALASPANDLPIRVELQNTSYRVLGRVQSYELNTQRETVDVTVLSDEFRNRISTIMSGSGRMSLEWEYTGDTAKELPHYLLELLLRTRVGSAFSARFYVKTSGYNPGGYTNASDDSIWYDLSGVLTACAISFASGVKVQVTADFITTGKIEIRMDLDPADTLVQENSDELIF